MSGSLLRIVECGWGTTVQDEGRVGLAHLGVPTAGAVDRASHDLVNRIVGNPVDAATIETLGGLVVEADAPVVVATSADGGRHTLARGERIRVDPGDHRLWAYLAVRGGIDVPPVLGSRSHDTLAALGPPPLVAGTALVIGGDPGSSLPVDLVPVRIVEGAVAVHAGPHLDWFADGLAALTSRPWHVTSDVSRVGCRLGSAAFARSARHRPSMASSGLVPGAIQVTPSGEPIVMLANHPTTGGYPVIAVVEPTDLGRVAQARPGSSLNFAPAAAVARGRR